MEKVIFQDLGLIPYQKAWDYQSELLKEVIEIKRTNRKLVAENQSLKPQKNYLLFCEHPPVYTLGKSGSLEHLLLSEQELEEQGFTFYKINRGGDITYHGPGQVVAYPIFDLECFFTDVHKYVRYLEEVVIRCLAEYGLNGIRLDGYTGVWFEPANGKPLRKICAIGVHLSRWVTMHGFAFNINTALNHFDHIIPCGISEDDKAVTSLEEELEHTVSIDDIKVKLKKHFSALFEFEYAGAIASN